MFNSARKKQRVITFQSLDVVRQITENGYYTPIRELSREKLDYSLDGKDQMVWGFIKELYDNDIGYNWMRDTRFFDTTKYEMTICNSYFEELYMIILDIDEFRCGITKNKNRKVVTFKEINERDLVSIFMFEVKENMLYMKSIDGTVVDIFELGLPLDSEPHYVRTICEGEYVSPLYHSSTSSLINAREDFIIGGNLALLNLYGIENSLTYEVYTMESNKEEYFLQGRHYLYIDDERYIIASDIIKEELNRTECNLAEVERILCLDPTIIDNSIVNIALGREEVMDIIKRVLQIK